MNDVFNALGRLFSAVLGLIFWLFAAALGLLLAAVVAVLLLVGVVWAVLRGRRPVRPVRPVYVHQFQTYARERVWPGRRGAASTATDEVVDVQVREVRDSAGGHSLPPAATER
ncbi:MAG: hypothetical protein Q8S02_01260 [Hydrogenophaga sp.]|nr:hypothetical protein [Hydrogenophaga sp.]